jgi:hypothetical protein
MRLLRGLGISFPLYGQNVVENFTAATRGVTEGPTGIALGLSEPALKVPEQQKLKPKRHSRSQSSTAYA